MTTEPVERGSTTEPASTSDAAAVSSEVAGYAQALENLRSKLMARMDLSVILQAMCTEVVQALTTADLAGITLVDEDGGQPETVASTDPRVNDVDADQYRSNEGPCLESARTQQMVRVLVSEVRDRWPRFARTVSDLGVGSYLSAPLTVDDRHLGALNIYSYDPHGFSDIDEALVGLFVSSIETAVMVSRRARTAEEEVDGLLTAMKTRAQIEQAKGIIMAMRGIGADEAFAFLSEQSQSRNIKVTDIAATLIASISADTGEKR
ncbi:GAF and ANTAR domain-containing protein [Rhodococcus fascians]|nr:GAF and ANTAR domain-containing protein [Rhodococcus fascians]MBY4059092.1 GAF and ANTAR domain-containing protein [Rhodococcus fascians]MBY4070365.1 GAF and ANTAR domain-containing protein [Rhodococcus fascians]